MEVRLSVFSVSQTDNFGELLFSSIILAGFE